MNTESVDDLLEQREQRLIAAALAEARAIDDARASSVDDETKASGPPADSFAGYDLVREIHRGAQGVVYQAIQHSTRRKVAVKVLRGGTAAQSKLHARFDLEVQLLGQLDHPNIVTVHDSGESDGRFFYVMDYIAGRPLDVYMAEHRPAVAATLALFARICEAVNAAHLRGVIHRDLKPGNILIDGDGQPHIVDFGLAKLASGAPAPIGADPMTITGQFLGSMPWASPEQAAGIPEQIDMRTDVYALGVLLFQMLTGEFPYDVTGPTNRVLDTIITAPARRPSTINAALNDEIDTIVLRCLSKERDRRYQTGGELARDVRRYLGGEPIEAKRDSGLYVFRKTLGRYRIPTTIAAVFLLVGLAFGVTMTALYQDARVGEREAQADAQDAREDAAAARAELETLREQLKQPASWRTTFASSDRIGALGPEEGWAFMQETWAQLDTVHAKQQMLKAVRFSEHPYVHRLLHLGATDPSLDVQDWAINYLRAIAFMDPAEDYAGYLQWHELNENRQLARVLEVNAARWIGSLADAGRDEQLQLLELVSGSTTLAAPGASEAVAANGLIPLLIDIIAAPDTPQDLRRAAGRTLGGLDVDEATLRESILPLTEPRFAPAARSIAVRMLGASRHHWATEHLLQMLLEPPGDDDRLRLDRAEVARALGASGDARVIPTLIGVIDADNSYDTIYGVGHSGLQPLTGVRYHESHDGRWWRAWWASNMERFPPEARAVAIPDLPKTAAGVEYEKRQAQGEPTPDVLLETLLSQVADGAGPGDIFTTARSIAELGDHSVIPTLIAAIEADDTYRTVYGIGYFALGRMTGVRYDESHDGAWWRRWWADNRSRYPEPIRSMQIPAVAAPTPAAAEDSHAGGDEHKRFFLLAPEATRRIPPPRGYKLLLVLPGGSGSDEFRPFVGRIRSEAVPDDYLVAQLVAPQWSPEQLEKLVWPTRTNPWHAMGFSTEDFIEAVIDEVKQRHPVDDRYVFALGWSSGGPPIYAASLAEQRRLTGSFIVMSVFWPQSLPALDRAAGHAYYLLHSPADFIPMSHPVTARDELEAHGATVELQEYEGGHGWHGDVYGNIATGLRWLETQVASRATGVDDERDPG